MTLPSPSAPSLHAGDALRRAAACLSDGDAVQARAWYAKAAEVDAGARVELGRMLVLGIGGAIDLAGAQAQWLAAESSGHPGASYLLATYPPGDDLQAQARLEHAAAAGLPVAQRALALVRARQDDEGAEAASVDLLRRAAARDPVSALMLAARAAVGEGMVRDHSLANHLHQQLAAHGLPPLPPVSPGPPTALRVLHEHPRVACADGVLSADECRLLIALMRPHLRRSQVQAEDREGQHVNDVRTSSSATVDRVIEDHAARRIQQRLAEAAGVPLLQAEAMSILHYAPGQQYRPHRDYLPPSALQADQPASGNRFRTLCVYLNDVESGGETEFPIAAVTVPPRAGRVVVFDNLDAQGRPDPDSLHAGLPVQRGEKWLGTLWFRERAYRQV